MGDPQNFRFVLVPGFWLGGWAWDAVAGELRGAGHDVSAVTLPGLGSGSEDRSAVHMADHIAAIVDALTAAPTPAVLALHSGAGMPGYAATDRVPGSVAAVVYVDTGPGTGAPMWVSFEGADFPLPSWPDLVADGNSINGLDEPTLATFRERAMPQPGNVLREGFELTDPARLAIPSTVLCTSATVAQTRKWVADGEAFVAELANLTGPVDWIDLPTGHWPMWSRPADLAAELVHAAERATTPR
ncbi:MAG TPA: alpha/beta hydrolase [Mycobacteriales bacterium]|nr:alpha/beta hydrolase [Mycobacteriales bacterium]